MMVKWLQRGEREVRGARRGGIAETLTVSPTCRSGRCVPGDQRCARKEVA